MVSFFCSQCGDTIKKKKAEVHLYKCRFAVLSCVDCGNEFRGNTYAEHSTCLTEAQKYEKPGTVMELPKGDRKQLDWFKIVQNAILSNKGSPKCCELLKRLQDFPNTPRKQKKFTNFVMNSLHGFKLEQVEEAWSVLSECASANTPNNEGTVNNSKVKSEESEKKSCEKDTMNEQNNSNNHKKIAGNEENGENIQEAEEGGKKKKKHSKGHPTNASIENDQVGEQDNLNDNSKESRKKKHKRKHEMSENDSVLLNSEVNGQHSVNGTEVEQSDNQIKRKKKKHNMDASSSVDCVNAEKMSENGYAALNSEVNGQHSVNETEVEQTDNQIKRKKKKHSMDASSSVDCANAEKPECNGSEKVSSDTNVLPDIVRKKKKKRHINGEQVQNEIVTALETPSKEKSIAKNGDQNIVSKKKEHKHKKRNGMDCATVTNS